MSTTIAVRKPQTVRLSSDQLTYIARTEFVPKQMRGNLPAIMACVATGRAMGLDDLSSLRLIHVIDGRPTFAAELMVQLVRKRGHSITGNFSAESCTVTGTRADNGDTMTVTWTMAMAEQAGLAKKDNYRKHPASMLWARAVSQLCRMLFADCFAGGTYTPEEVETADLDFDTDSVDGRADSQAGLQRARDAALPDGGSTDQAPGMGARTPEPTPNPEPASAAQRKKLDVLVGKLRALGKDPTGWLYEYLGVGPETLTGGRDEAGLHWGPLRDTLSREQASELIDALEGTLERVSQGSSGALSDGGGAADDAGAETAAAGNPSAAAAPPLTAEQVAEAARMVVPQGVHKGRTLAQVADTEGGPAWLLGQLKAVPAGAPPRGQIETFTRALLPDVWAGYEAWLREQA